MTSLPAARAAFIDPSGRPTPQFYRFLETLTTAQAGNVSPDEITAINAQLAELQAEIAALPSAEFPKLQVTYPILSQGLLQNGFAKLALDQPVDSGGGSLLKIVRDAWGRIAGTSTPTTTDLAEGSNLYFTAARVLATALAGLSTATNAVITAADSVLVALGKLQAQITANNSASVHLAGAETITGAKTFNAAITGNDANSLYYRKNNQTANYTLVAADVGTYIGIFAPLTVTIPPNVFSVLGPSGSPIAGVVRFVQNSNPANIVTLSPGSGVLISGPTATTGPNQILEAINISLNGWVTHLYT